MATTLNASCRASVAWDYHNVLASIGDTANTNGFTYAPTAFTPGTAANQVDRFYVTSGTIAASGNVTVTVTALSDLFANSLNWLRVKVFYVENQIATTASSLLLGASGVNSLINWCGAAAQGVVINNGGVFFLCAPDATAYAVTAATGDVIKLLNQDGANTSTYRLALAGCSA